jgi:hypothetical protein
MLGKLGPDQVLTDAWMPGAFSGFWKTLCNVTVSINATLRACGNLTGMPIPQQATVR